MTTAQQAELLRIVQALARMTTPTDGVEDDEEADDIMADLGDEQLCSDSAALYHMIREARTAIDIVEGPADADSLLRAVQYALNHIPNHGLPGCPGGFRNTYQLASAVDAAIKGV
jgi:hypothetical protein